MCWAGLGGKRSPSGRRERLGPEMAGRHEVPEAGGTMSALNVPYPQRIYSQGKKPSQLQGYCLRLF